MYYPMYFDPTYFLVLIGVIICLAASAKMKSTFNRYSRVRSHSGMTGRQAAEEILRRAGIYDVRIEHISGSLTDHYDPRSKVLRLSDTVYNQTSVAAMRACNPASDRLCAFVYPGGSCPCGKFRKYDCMAFDYNRNVY